MAPTFLITHLDLDGYGCAALGRLLWQDAWIEYAHYNNIDRIVRQAMYEVGQARMKGDPSPYSQIVMADIAPASEEVLRECVEFQSPDCPVIILDHHESSPFAEFADRDVLGIYDEDRCGTRLVWDRFQNSMVGRVVGDTGTLQHLRQFVDVVEVRDTWQTESPLWKQSLRLNKLAHTLGRDEFVSRCMVRLGHGEAIAELHEHEGPMVEILLEMDERYIEGRVKFIERCVDSEGRVYHWVQAHRLASEIADRVLQTVETDYVAVVMPERANVELRSDGKKVDVGKLAEARGGGGHPDAAGYGIDRIDRVPMPKGRGMWNVEVCRPTGKALPFLEGWTAGMGASLEAFSQAGAFDPRRVKVSGDDPLGRLVLTDGDGNEVKSR